MDRAYKHSHTWTRSSAFVQSAKSKYWNAECWTTNSNNRETNSKIWTHKTDDNCSSTGGTKHDKQAAEKNRQNSRMERIYYYFLFICTILLFWSECMCVCAMSAHATWMWSLFYYSFFSICCLHSTFDLSSNSYPIQLRRFNIFIGNQLHSFFCFWLICALSVCTLCFANFFLLQRVRCRCCCLCSSLLLLHVCLHVCMCMCVCACVCSYGTIEYRRMRHSVWVCVEWTGKIFWLLVRLYFFFAFE